MEKQKIRILVITSMPWRNDNNIGNSYSNIFSGLEHKIEFAHIYCRSGMPQNNLCHKYFQITEKDIISNIRNRNYLLGRAFYLDNPNENTKEEFSNIYNHMRILRWELFFLGRNILWNLSEWKNKRFTKFIEDFSPDIIFGTLTYMPNINKMMIYLKETYNIPLVVYSWDDVYSLKQFSLSPFFWLRRFEQRKWIRKCVEKSDKMYVITRLMQKEYDKCFKKSSSLLYKGYSYKNELYQSRSINIPIQFVFMGNLGAGRWKTLVKFVKTLTEINKTGIKAILKIYTLSPLTRQMRNKLTVKGISNIMPNVPNEKVMDVLKSADILIHVEPINLKDKLFYRLSFTTKLVDYFKSGRCILGLGGKTASLMYLEDYDCGIVIYDISKMSQTVKYLIEHPDIIQEYAKKAWDCGYKNHQIENIQANLYRDFVKLVPQN